MTTTIPRISIVLDGETLATIKALSKKTKTSLSKICSKLVTNQLEYDEDAYWMRIIGEEKARGLKTIGHEEFWNRVNVQD